MSRLASWREPTDLVYEPAEDSTLLLDNVVGAIRSTDRVLDVGTGSGFLAHELRLQRGADVVGVDVNPHACRQAAVRGVPVVRGDLVAPFRSETFDVVVCNPPYLPTPPEMAADDWLERALDGGPTGLRITNRVLDSVGRILTPDGTVFLLVSSLQDIDRIHERAAANGFTVSTVGRDDSFPFEVLSVFQLDPVD